jgi:hypothetical protein
MRNVAFIQTVARAIYKEACVAIRVFLPGNFNKELYMVPVVIIVVLVLCLEHAS